MVALFHYMKIWEKGIMNKKFYLDKILRYIVTIYFILIITILPLYFQNKYFDMVRTKANVFISVTGSIALLFIVCNIFGVLLNQDSKTFPVNFIDRMFILFLICAIFSTLCSENKEEAMWGSAGWHVGTSFFILCGAAYYMLSRHFQWKDVFSGLIAVVNLIVLILGMGNAIGIDPLKMNEGIAKTDYGKYLSTIGNVNWYAGYLCIILSLSTIVFVMSKHFVSRVMSAVIVLLCIINGIACNSDGFFIGVIPIIVYVLYVTLQSKEGLRKLIEFISLWEISILVTVMLKNKFIVVLDSIQNRISSYFGILMLLFLFIVALILYKIDSESVYKNSKKIVNGILITAGMVVLFMVLISNFVLENSSQPFISKFRLNGAWGTNRGYIWGYTLKIFLKLNPIQMLFGIGPDTYGIIFRKFYFDEMLSIWNKNVINAHSEPLQLLITNGIAGLIAYYGIFISAVNVFITRNRIELKAISVAIISYLCQGLVNNIQGICTPLVFIMLGVGMSIVFREDLEAVY